VIYIPKELLLVDSTYFTSLLVPMRCEIGCKLVLFTNSKSHTSFQYVPTVVTLDDPEPRNGRYFASFHPKLYFGANYVKLVKFDA